MMDNSDTREAIISRILSLGFAMFQSVPTAQRAVCQDRPETFKLHRRAQLSAWSVATLQSYLNDLSSAQASGTNLMAIKYARMDDLIPEYNTNPLIDDILRRQCGWQEEMFARYPFLMRGGRPLRQTEDAAYTTSFETYLRGELETYSDSTLTSLHEDMMRMSEQGMNMAHVIYDTLVRDLGYESLEEAEETARFRADWT